MNIVTEANLAGKPIGDKPHKRPVRMLRWFIIVGLVLSLLVGGLVWFNYFRGKMIAQFFANNKPPPASVSIADAKSEVIPNLLTAVGDLAAVHQVNVTSDVNGRITDIMFTAGASVKQGDPLVQLFDAPDQGDLASFKAQATVAQLSLDRAKQLASRQFGPQATVDSTQAAFDQANAGIAKTEAIISQKLVRAQFDGELGVRHVEVGQFLTAGTQIVSLTDLSSLYANFTITEKDSAHLKVGQTVRVVVDAYPGRKFEGKITTIEPQISTDTRNIRVQATIANPDHILKPGMFATTTVVLPDKPPVVTVPETAVDYTLYGDSRAAAALLEHDPEKRIPLFPQDKREAFARTSCFNTQLTGTSAMAITDIFIKRPVLSVVVSLLILLIGFRAATTMPIRQYPKLSNTVVNVTTVYPGASADLIQGFITTPIEQAVASAEGVDYMTSSSVLGTSTIQVYIKLNFDPNQALTEVLAKTNSVKYLIPKEANDPIVTKTTGQTTAVMYLGFSSEELSGSAISDYLVRVLQPVLSTVDGVASADILGGQTFAMRLWLDPVKMAGRGVSPNDVSAAITANNFQAAAGQAKGYFTVSNISTNTDLRNLDQFKRMIVKSKDGGFVRIEDIATVELAAQSTDASVAFNGEHAIFIGVQATPQGNPLTLVRGVRALFPELERNLPPSMKMKVAYDSTRFIQSSIDEVKNTLIEAVLIVLVGIFLCLASFRSGLIPVVTIPLSLS